MNWSDILVLAIIVGFAFVGLKTGFIYSIYRLASFFVAAIISVKFYPLVAAVLEKTPIYSGIRSSIFNNLTAKSPEFQEQGKDAVFQNLNLPGFIEDILRKQPEIAKVADNATSKAVEAISDILAHFVIDIISLVLLYIIVRVALFFGKFVVQGISKLPVLKQVDKVGGIALGIAEGLLTVYIIFSLLMLFSTSPQFAGFYEAVNNSLVAKFFYENNFIVDWMFPKDKIV